MDIFASINNKENQITLLKFLNVSRSFPIDDIDHITTVGENGMHLKKNCDDKNGDEEKKSGCGLVERKTHDLILI